MYVCDFILPLYDILLYCRCSFSIIVPLGASFLGSRACLEALVWYASARGKNMPVPALPWRLGGNG